mgnify:CR=1 FL=1
MNQKNLTQGLFRISAILYARNDSSNVSIKQVIRKIIEDVLYHKVGKGYCHISKLITLINEEHYILLSDDEIIRVIKDKKFSEHFIICYDAENGIEVSLSEKRRDALQVQSNKKNLFDYISEFINQKNLPKTYIEIFNRFFYDVFATNLEGYERLLKGKSIFEEGNSNFSDDEKKVINEFLNWENQEKNQAIYYLANYAIEYCMLVNKKDSYFDITFLKNKRLYLDTNILFRALGVNGEDRKCRTEQFLSKFKQVGQNLYITKETDNEFKNTLDYYTDKLRESFTPKCKVNPKVYLETVNIDGFYKHYCNWRINKQDCSIDNYKRQLKAKYDEILSRFSIQKDSLIPYSFEDKQDLIAKYSSQIVSSGDEKTHTAAEIDARNIIWIETKRNGENNDLYKVSDYLISSDQSLRKWDYRRNLNDVPIVMMPSQWLSLILRYMERTENDYTSFVNFLNIKVSNQCLEEEQMFSIIKGISEVTSDIEQQRYLVKAYINEDLENSLQDIENEKIEEKAKEYAKTKLEKKIETLEDKQLKNEGKIASLEECISKMNADSTTLINDKQEEILKIEKKLTKAEGKIKEKDDKIAELELKNWKRPRYWWCSIGLLLCIIVFIMYFIAPNWVGNLPARLIHWIDGLEGSLHNMSFGVLCFIHTAGTLLCVIGLTSLFLLNKDDDKQHWFFKLVIRILKK